MKIAIADDLQCDRESISEYLLPYLKSKEIEADISEYKSGGELVMDFSEKRFDIIFLDIYMEDMNGIEAAKNIYEMDKDVHIIFITTANCFAAESYEFGATYYILKPLTEEKFTRAMELCFKDLIYAQKKLHVISNRVSVDVPFDKILYIDVHERMVKIHLSDCIISSEGRFYATVEPLLAEKNFIESFKGVVVNMEHVKCVKGIDFILDNGEAVPIRKREKTDIIRQYMKFEFNKL